MKSLQMVNQW